VKPRISVILGVPLHTKVVDLLSICWGFLIICFTKQFLKCVLHRDSTFFLAQFENTFIVSNIHVAFPRINFKRYETEQSCRKNCNAHDFVVLQ
jgi:uncharacterized membrane protein (DUF485 family)